MPTADELRKLAAWYREFAEWAGEPAIWEGRLRTAKELEAEAVRIEDELYLDTAESAASQEAHSPRAGVNDD